jgi:hypothetical protein
MARSAAHGPLTAFASTRSVRFARATPDDDAAIRRLLRDNPMSGSVSLSLEREPTYFGGSNIGGATDDTILAYENDRLLCMGRCSTRESFVAGEPKRVAYLGELRLDTAAAARIDILRGGYRFFRELHAAEPPDFTFTSIASDNHRALRLLERGLPGLPAYTFLTEYVTLVIPVPHRTARSAITTTPATLAHHNDLVTLLISHAQNHTFAPRWTSDLLLSLAHHDLPPRHFQLAFAGPRLIAAAAIWDQRRFRQTVIRGYESTLAATGPLLNLSALLFGTPRLPAIGSTLAHAYLSPLALVDDHAAMLPDMIAAMLNVARTRGLEFLTLGLVATDPRMPLLKKRFQPRLYHSRLYRVAWPEDSRASILIDPTRLWPEVALL